MKSRKPEVERLSTHYDANEERLLEDYFAFLRFKSISSEKENRQEMLDCADWLKRYLEGMDFQVEIWEGSGHPVVYARNTSSGPDKPTVLIYNHYDVQPVDPLELWESPPFEPVVRDGSVYARGAQDNKGQAFFVIAALKSLLDLDGRLPVNVKLCLDGEEESGSTVLGNLLEKKKEALSADYMIIADLGMGNQNKPSISLGVRGIASMTLVVTGSKTDFHSGTHGGIVYNPNHALVEMLAKLRDDSGRVAVPG
ncbi:MAG: M20 family dipeptidase, partial [Proteobacteria bacterium]|nr:M20 family dipeptidase [Pseudomonadota bacterium]